MKKSIIAAGAASIALAAMPVVSTFAAQPTREIVDNINVNLNSTCTMTRTGASGTDGTWTAGDPATTAAGTYTVASMSAGTTANIGASTFTIVCNDTTNGHSLQVAASGLRRGETSDYIDYSNAAVAAGTSSWNITISDVDGFGNGEAPAVKPANGIVGIAYGQDSHTGSTYLYGETTTSKNAISGGSFKATYNVGTTTTQAAGQYTGSATYTLTYGANS